MPPAFRSLAKSPGFTLVSLAIVALGIGAVTAMFSVVNALVLRPIALPEPARLAVVHETHLERNLAQFDASIPNYADWVAQSRSWESLAAFTGSGMNLTAGGEPELVQAPRVTANFLRTLGIEPALGRDFLSEEDRPGGARVAIVSTPFWQQRLGGANDVLGRTLVLDGTPYVVVGVTPPDAAVPVEFDLLVPLTLDPARENRMNHYINVVGRLARGVTLAQADTEMKALAARIFATLPNEDRGWSTRVVSLESQIVHDQVRRGLYLLFAAVGVLLLIVCANLSNLILVRATARAHELAVRTALGASRWHLARMLIGESLLVTALGGAAGLLLAWWSIGALRSLPLPRAAEISADPRVLAIACVATLLSALLATAGPALHASRARPQEALKTRALRSGQRSRLRDSMVVAQIALSLTLLIGSALLVRSFWRLLQVNPGFNADHVLTFALRPRSDDRVAFYDAVEREVAALPGITHAGSIRRVPLTPGNTQNEVYPVGPSARVDGKPVQASWRLIHGDYFGAMQISLLRGHDFRRLSSGQARSSMMISASLARALWGEADPIGRQIDRAGARFTVIGVVDDVRGQQLAAAAMPTFYMSIHRFIYGSQTMVVRTSGKPDALANALRDVVRRIDPTVPIFEVRTMEDVRAASLQHERLLIGLLGGFGVVALVLAALGTYGVVAFTVQQRTPEIGIRIAIGAQARDVLRLVISQGARLVAVGIALGIVGAFAATQLLATLLYETASTDPLSYATATLFLALAALLASFIPARRATKVDPMVALRAE